MEIVTYSLKNEQENSDEYYRDIEEFTHQVISEINRISGRDVNAFRVFVIQSGLEKPCSVLEYSFELLMIGLLWRIYGGSAKALNRVSAAMMTWLSSLRRKNICKPAVDCIRGIFSTLFLDVESEGEHTFEDLNIRNLQKLILWMEATGDFYQEAKRIRQWHKLLIALPEEEADQMLSRIILLAEWFENASEIALGKYTEKVAEFLENRLKSHRWHEDFIFCGRQRAEYHLNMVGAEMMNRAFREEFMKSKAKAVLLPACMCLLPKGACKAYSHFQQSYCKGCSPQCTVNQLTQLGKEHDFEVRIISHETNALELMDESTGVIGVACVGNLVSGGWKAKGMGLPAQCILLDYCGCKNHWHDKGIVTNINIEQLKKILKI